MSAAVAVISPDELHRGTLDVFEMMFFRSLDILPQRVDTATGFTVPAFLVTVEFLGDAAGLCELAITAAEASVLSIDFLALEEELPPDSDRIIEVLCELANMLCGHTLSRCRPGALFQILSPVCVTLGPGSALPEGDWCRFQLDDGEIALRFVLRLEDSPSRLPTA